MKKYLLWLVCMLRGHIWREETSGFIDGMHVMRAKCQRCKMHCFVKVPE